MIDISSDLYESFTAAPQFENMWDFNMLDWKKSNYNISQFKVISTSLPFLSFENGTHISGHTYYTGYKMPDTFSITFREDSDFAVTNYFKDWEAQIFNVHTGCFISSQVKKTRDGIFTYSKSKLKLTNEQLFALSVVNKLKAGAQMAVDTLDSRIVAMANEMTDKTSGMVANQARGLLQAGTSKARDLGSSTLSDLTEASTSAKIAKYFELETTKSYSLIGIRYLGISAQEAGYTSGEELKVTVNFTVDTILDEREEARAQNYSVYEY